MSRTKQQHRVEQHVIAEMAQSYRLHKLARPESTSDLHYRLGKAVEDVPGKLLRRDGSGKSHDTDVRHFEGLGVIENIAQTPIIDAMATPELCDEADRQWNAIPTDLAELRRWMRGEPINPQGDAMDPERRAQLEKDWK